MQSYTIRPSAAKKSGDSSFLGQNRLQGHAEGREKQSPMSGFGMNNFGAISILPSSPTRVQPKLKINTPRDRYEQEADRVAEQVMRMPEQTVQRKCASCGKEEEIQRSTIGNIQRKCAKCEEEEMIQMKSQDHSGNMVSSTLMNQIQSTRGQGQAMDVNTRSFMEPRFGMDFSGVRIHADKQAAQMSQGINARAFTVGSDIYFNQGAYTPGTTDGKRLLAHELTHVVQQGRDLRMKENQTQNCPTQSCKGYTNSNCSEYIKNSWWLPMAYVNNATLACLETPNHPTAKCVRKTLQDRLKRTPSEFKQVALSMKSLEISNPIAYNAFVLSKITPRVYNDHVVAYRTAGCPSGPASYAAWIAVTTVPMLPGTVGLSIQYGGGSCSGRLGHWC